MEPLGKKGKGMQKNTPVQKYIRIFIYKDSSRADCYCYLHCLHFDQAQRCLNTFPYLEGKKKQLFSYSFPKEKCCVWGGQRCRLRVESMYASFCFSKSTKLLPFVCSSKDWRQEQIAVQALFWCGQGHRNEKSWWKAIYKFAKRDSV